MMVDTDSDNGFSQSRWQREQLGRGTAAASMT